MTRGSLMVLLSKGPRRAEPSAPGTPDPSAGCLGGPALLGLFEHMFGHRTSRKPQRRSPMLSAEQNALITRTGPGTPADALMRRYWQPAALVDELSGKRPV